MLLKLAQQRRHRRRVCRVFGHVHVVVCIEVVIAEWRCAGVIVQLGRVGVVPVRPEAGTIPLHPSGETPLRATQQPQAIVSNRTRAQAQPLRRSRSDPDATYMSEG